MTNPRCSWCGEPSHEPTVDEELIVCPKCGTAGITCDEWQEESKRQTEAAAWRVSRKLAGLPTAPLLEYRIFAKGFPSCCLLHARFYWSVLYDLNPYPPESDSTEYETSYMLSLN